jgi:hypothetical protein
VVQSSVSSFFERMNKVEPFEQFFAALKLSRNPVIDIVISEINLPLRFFGQNEIHLT